MPKNIIIVGPPRSGTSLTAAVFAKKGYYVGPIASSAMRDGDDNNPYGYFEADELIARNVDILRRAGFSAHNTWKYAPITAEEIKRIADVPPDAEDHAFERTYAAHQPWVWKDPRLCYTLPVWAGVVDRSATAIVVVHRAPAEIYRSFLRMGWCGKGATARRQTEERIVCHARHAEASARKSGLPYAVVHYRDYLTHPSRVALQLAGLSGLYLAPEDLNVQKDLSHSSARGRLAARLRRSLDRGALRPLKALRPVVPMSLLTALLPEKKHGSTPASRAGY